MKFFGLSPMLYTEHLKDTIAFYVDNLGFECERFSDDWQWASLRKDNVTIMITAPNPHLPFKEPQFTGSLYILTDDVDAVWHEVKSKTRICYPIENFEYGMREFAVYDNNGYLIQFGQEVQEEIPE